MRKPFPAGYCHAPTAGLRKIQRGPISTIGLSFYQYGTNSGDPLGQTKLFWAIAGWCATTGGRQPFSFSKARKRPSLLVVAHKQAKPTEGAGATLGETGSSFSADFRGGVTRLIRTQFCRWRGRFSVVFPASAICGASPHKQVPPHFLPPSRRVSPAFILASLSPRPLICGPFPHDELLLPWDQTARPTSQMG